MTYSFKRLFSVLGLLLAASTPSHGSDAGARDWAHATLASMTLEEKAAQMVTVRVFGYPLNVESDEYLRLVDDVRRLKVGGLVVFASEVDSLPRLLNRLQREADVPLLVSADTETGMAFRIRHGVVPLPYAMAVAATRSEEAARFSGRLTAREARALGVHWALAPVVDVNVNPANPVIDVRSYGEDPELVARLAAAYVEGVHEGGILTTAKHFPGHGDTAVDSHLALPTVSADRARLEAVELLPFRRTIEAGVDAVMIGHLAVPALDPSLLPATLSPAMVGGLLRRGMGFSGLVITDAMEMKGVGDLWAGEAAVHAVQAGADVVALPPDTRVAIQSLVRAVGEGELTEERLDASVLRILEAKARLGLDRERFVDLDDVERRLADPADVERAEELARASITLVRNVGGVLPIHAEKPLRLLHLTLASDLRRWPVAGIPEDELEARRIDFDRRVLGPEISAETEEEIVASASRFTHIVISAYLYPQGFGPHQKRLVQRLATAGPPVVLMSFGSPYLLTQVPEVPVYVCAYGPAFSSQRAAIGALFGEYDVHGKLPVSLPELYPYGHGIQMAKHKMTLRVEPEDERFAEVDRLLQGFVEQRAFPGAVLAVGYRGALVHLRPFGNLSYDDGAAGVRADTIYDLASLTKVVATTTMAMILFDEGRIDLDARVRSFLPRFVGPGKEAVTIRHLLTHSSGVDWWAPLYKELRGKEAFLDRIYAMELAYETGTETKYSDLGLMLLGEILERASGEALDTFVRERIFAPLRMKDTLFRPGKELLPRIAPTEFDPWRRRVVRGEVHDENAFALGGVAPHAGLFSTAGDLARFVQMILNGGVFEHHRLISRATVDLFTKRANLVPESTRALGWDTKSDEGSSAGTLFSPRSFGHTGFTGTSIWVDPERELFVILLTNRVHPTRENVLIRQVRPAVADAVVRAVSGSNGK